MEPVASVAATVAGMVAQQLLSRNWQVIIEKVGSQRRRQSDIVATDPRGRTYVIEVKLGKGHTHFSEVAQVESAASDLRNEKQASSVTPILLTNKEVPSSIEGVAEEVGVEIVKASGSGDQVADALVTYLDANARA